MSKVIEERERERDWEENVSPTERLKTEAESHSKFRSTISTDKECKENWGQALRDCETG